MEMNAVGIRLMGRADAPTTSGVIFRTCSEKKSRPQAAKARASRRSAKVSWWRLSFQNSRPTATKIREEGMKEEIARYCAALAAAQTTRISPAMAQGQIHGFRRV